MRRFLPWLGVLSGVACAALPAGLPGHGEVGVAEAPARTGGLLLRTSVQPAGRTQQARWIDVRTIRVQARDARATHEATLRREDLEGGSGAIGFDRIFPGNVLVQASLFDAVDQEVGSASVVVEVLPGLVAQAEVSVRLRPTVVVAGSVEASLKVVEGEVLLASATAAPYGAPALDPEPALVHEIHHAGDADAAAYQVSQVGVRVFEEAWGRSGDPLTYWGPASATKPGTLVYRYDFAPRHLARGHLSVRTSTWDYTTGSVCCGSGRGSVLIEASGDGKAWVPWFRSEPVGKVEDGQRELEIPGALAGASAFWVRLTLNSTVAGSYANAQIARASVAEERPGYRFEAILR